jgi:hypothetical protein
MEAEVGATGAEGEVGVTDSVGGVLVVMVLLAEDLAVMVLAHRAQVLADAALVRDSAGRMDLRVEAFLVGEIAVASVIGVSVGEIAAFAIVGFAISKETLSILVFMALDIQIITNTATHTHTTTDTRITTRTRITTISVDSAGGATDHLNPVKIASVVGRNSSIRARLVMLVSRSSRDDKRTKNGNQLWSHSMQLNQHIEKMARPWSSTKMLNDGCTGFFLNDMGPAALLAVVFGVYGRACDRLFLDGRRC